MQLQELLLSLSVAISTVHGWSPTDSYAPGEVTCDANVNLVRNATGLSSDEQEWLKKRDAITESAMKAFLTRATANFSDTSFLDSLFENSSYIPRVGIAASGGGYRAMLSGAGMLAAFDNRTRGANENGLGGLLQATTYLAGISGGNWLTGTLAWNNWTSVQEIIDSFSDSNTSSIWDITNSIVTPGGDNSTFTNERFASIIADIDDKQEAGFDITLVDVWGRMLSYYFFPSLPDGGAAYTWSTLRDADVFMNAEMPFPISVADGQYPDTSIDSLNSTVFEFNPFEMGSWDPTLNAFTDVKYLGTNVSNGSPIESGKCIAGFDNTGFIIGTSSDILNDISSSYEAVLEYLETEFLTESTATSNEYTLGIYSPNPFKDTTNIDSNYSTSIVDSDSLYLADGGEDGEVVPFIPLIKKEREIDVVFAFDNDNDSDDWPSGSNLISTYERQFSSQGKSIAFPYVPDLDTFSDLGLNERPTFFGCDASNLTDLAYVPPLIVYIPNAQYSYPSNTSTYTLSYSMEERLEMIQNGYEAATRNNLTEDSDFLGCVGCAVMRRKQESLNITLPSECEKCFANYCWNGTFTDVSSVGSSNSSYSNSTTTLFGGAAESTTASSNASSSSFTYSSSAASSSSAAKANTAASFKTGKLFSLLTAFGLLFSLM